LPRNPDLFLDQIVLAEKINWVLTKMQRF